MFDVVSGTTLRFASLVAAVVGTSTYVFGILYVSVPAKASATAVAFEGCGRVSENDPYSVERGRLVAECVAGVRRDQARWVLVGLALLALTAAALYLLTPWWIRRRSRLVPIDGPRFSALTAALRDLSAEAGLRTAPEFLLDPAAGSPGGLAFGHLRRHFVRLNAGLIPLRMTQPAVFRAVVLHELAHLRNRDVDMAYATMALWRAFFAVAMVPILIVTLYPAPGRNYLQSLLDPGLRLAALAVVVYLARNAVLRSRELYADARAAKAGAGEGLRAALARMKPAIGWRRRLGVHPDPQARLGILREPLLLLRPRPAELVETGITTMIAVGALNFFAWTGLGTLASHVTASLAALLIAAMLTAVAWRAEISSARAAVMPAALALGGGLLIGDQLTISNSTSSWGVFGSAPAANQLPLPGSVAIGAFSLTSALVAAVVLVLAIAWQAAISSAGAQAWLPRLRSPSTRAAWLTGATVTAIPLAAWFRIWFDSHTVPFLIGRTYHVVAGPGEQIWTGPLWSALSLTYPPLTLFMALPLAIPVLILAWLYPLAARTATVWPAARTGLFAAATFTAVLLAYRAALHMHAAGLAATEGFAVYYSFSVIAAAVVAMAVAAAATTGLAQGQLAAFLSGIACTAAILGSQLLGGCVTAIQLGSSACALSADWGFTWFLLRHILIQGAIAALLLQALTAATTRLRLAPRIAVMAGVLAAFTLGVGATHATAPPASAPPAPTASAPAAPGDPHKALQTAISGLPPSWIPKPPSESSPSTLDNPACQPLYDEAYGKALDARPHDMATAAYTNNGKLALSTFDITIKTFRSPLDDSPFTQADVAVADCPRFRVTTSSGFEVDITAQKGTAPGIGDKSWRADLTLTSTSGGVDTRARHISVLVRTGQTMIVASMVAVNEPLNDAVLLAAISRAVAVL
ncbi:M48 family metalloprotease [Rhizocola hellebori]|uniref:M48 family metalloprotease n=1 Tax=Rhizocola hellebori TaxID=1392758 RepID=UPI0019404AEA|nr:M48 family metalloprotease [Rhizocola hellebori]